MSGEGGAGQPRDGESRLWRPSARGPQERFPTTSSIISWVRGFSRVRLLGGAIGALLVMAFLAAEPVSGQLIGVAVQWWAYPTIGVAALLAGVVVSSFIQPRRGAEPTVCEVGPVLLGLGAA
jgi:hypothetical protein